MKRLTILLLVASLAACTQPQKATRILEDAGYTNIHMNGYGFWACGQDDQYSDAFTATGPTGRPVSGVVCAGFLFKSSTIRLD